MWRMNHVNREYKGAEIDHIFIISKDVFLCYKDINIIEDAEDNFYIFYIQTLCVVCPLYFSITFHSDSINV
jgi:hypothetical protein